MEGGEVRQGGGGEAREGGEEEGGYIGASGEVTAREGAREGYRVSGGGTREGGEGEGEGGNLGASGGGDGGYRGANGGEGTREREGEGGFRDASGGAGVRGGEGEEGYLGATGGGGGGDRRYRGASGGEGGGGRGEGGGGGGGEGTGGNTMERSPMAMTARWGPRWVVAMAGAMALLGVFIFGAEYFLEEGAGGELSEELGGNGRVIGSVGSADKKLPVFAFLITGSAGQVASMRRLLYAVYHPRNEYLLHYDRAAPAEEHAAVAQFVRDERAFAEAGNVRVVTRPNAVTYKGASMTTTYLHGLALLLRRRADWDWFLNLSAADYPLVTPDDMLHVFSSLPRHLNFIAHSVNQTKVIQLRSKLMFLDSEFSSGEKELLRVNYNRSMPTAFNFFKGSAWVVFSRAFSEYTIFGYENFPRTLLLYLANTLSSPELYFHTLICNSPDFNSSVLNTDLRYVKWEGGQHPVTLTTSHFPLFSKWGAPFARKFGNGSEEALEKIDQELLNRGQSRFVKGGWCGGSNGGGGDPCETIGDISVLNITDNVQRLEQHIHAFSNSQVFPKCMQLLKLFAKQNH